MYYTTESQNVKMMSKQLSKMYVVLCKLSYGDDTPWH